VFCCYQDEAKFLKKAAKHYEALAKRATDNGHAIGRAYILIFIQSAVFLLY
jgi:hypothetical protein